MPRRRRDDDMERFWHEDEEGFSSDEEKDEEGEEEEFEDEEDEEDAFGEDDEEEYAEGSTGIDDLDAMLEEGEQLAEDGELDEAIEKFSDAVESFPNNPVSHYNLGLAHFMKLKEDMDEAGSLEDFTDEGGHYEEAVACFGRALELDEDYVLALNHLGRLLVLRDRNENAIELLKRSLDIDPDQPDVQQDLEELEKQMEDEE